MRDRSNTSCCPFGGGLVAAVAVALAGTAYSQSAVQWRVADGGNGHWYQRLPRTSETWDQLRTVAATAGGTLASSTSGAENAFIRSVAFPTGAPGGNCALGGLRPGGACGGAWQWIDGTHWSYTNWDGGQPDCAGEEIVVIYGSGVWHDYPRGGAVGSWTGAIIEWSADCNGDGIVDYGQCRDGSLPDYDCDNVPDCCEAATSCVVGRYPVQFRAADGGNGHWYTVRVYQHVVQWDEARVQAEGDGAYLATLTSQSENDFVMSLVGANGPWFAPGLYPDVLNGPWLGGSRASLDSPWSWVTGEEWGFTAFCLNQPSNNACVEPENRLHIKLGADCLPNRGWGDISASAWCPPELPGLVSAVVEWSADCDADGVVDYGQILRGEVADVNGNGIADTCDCPADINQSGTIDAEDLAYVLFAWGMTGGKAGDADINGDAMVDANDLALVLGSWGPCPN